MITLKNPNSSQALTRRCLESGLERSIKGIPENNVVGLQFLVNENCSIVGLDRSTIAVAAVVVRVFVSILCMRA